ncbi:calcium/proton exchanger [bacterium]|nr:calcium/proton exchanger [bacterium]
MKLSLNWLLIFVPIAAVLNHLHAGPAAVFFASCLAIIPLAGIMGHATEILADRAGAAIGGLLNATFGNAAELIIAYVAMSKGLHDVVKASLIGSIIGNILLVLGVSTLVGGTRYKILKFNITAASSGASMLLLSAVGLLVPAMYAHMAKNPESIRELSTEIAIVLLVCYLCSLIFSLNTHKYLYDGGAAAEAVEEAEQAGAEAPEGSIKGAILTLMVSTFVVAWMSEILVGVVEAASEAMGLTDVFVGIIVVAVIGNAAEHSSAVMMALKDKMDVAFGIAVGSSIQIALFVAPVLVLCSLWMNKPMDLVFSEPEVMAVIISVLVVGQISQDGESHWLEGVQLLSVYFILAFVFFHIR